MTKWTPNKIEIIQIVIMLITVVISLFEMVGKPARLVVLLTLMFGSIGVGASLGSYIQKRRKIPSSNKKKKSGGLTRRSPLIP
jgi:H+/Cl- antiporter ClcA